MGQKTRYWCDICDSTIYDAKLLQKFDRKDGGSPVDICEHCRRKIVEMLIRNGGILTLILRPFCKTCNGVGRVSVDEDSIDHITRTTKECEECRFL